MTRYTAAALVSAALALYAFVFATQSHNAYDLPTYIDVSEWPAVLLYLAAGYLSYIRREQLAALTLVLAMITFFAAHARFLFSVPLGFVLIVTGSLAFLIILPVTWKPR